MEVVRLAEPALFADQNTVEVRYHIFVRDKQSSILADFEECHRMRYLFSTEIAMMLDAAVMELEASFEFMTGKAPDYNTWNVLHVGRKL